MEKLRVKMKKKGGGWILNFKEWVQKCFIYRWNLIWKFPIFFWTVNSINLSYEVAFAISICGKEHERTKKGIIKLETSRSKLLKKYKRWKKKKKIDE